MAILAAITGLQALGCTPRHKPKCLNVALASSSNAEIAGEYSLAASLDHHVFEKPDHCGAEAASIWSQQHDVNLLSVGVRGC